MEKTKAFFPSWKYNNNIIFFFFKYCNVDFLELAKWDPCRQSPWWVQGFNRENDITRNKQKETTFSSTRAACAWCPAHSSHDMKTKPDAASSVRADVGDQRSYIKPY